MIPTTIKVGPYVDWNILFAVLKYTTAIKLWDIIDKALFRGLIECMDQLTPNQSLIEDKPWKNITKCLYLSLLFWETIW